MTDIHDLVPKNKFDSSNIERLKHLTDNEIEPILPSLLEWIQDCNWPVAGDILPVLALHQSALVPLIHRVLSPHEKDDIWKYWIITCLAPLFSDESINCILSDIQRIAKSPTQGELREEVHEAAVIFLQNRLSKTGRYHHITGRAVRLFHNHSGIYSKSGLRVAPYASLLRCWERSGRERSPLSS